MTTRELTALINLAYEAVNTSAAGPIHRDQDEQGRPVLNTLGYQTFLMVVSNIVPRAAMNFKIDEPKEEWQE